MLLLKQGQCHLSESHNHIHELIKRTEYECHPFCDLPVTANHPHIGIHTDPGATNFVYADMVEATANPEGRILNWYFADVKAEKPATM